MDDLVLVIKRSPLVKRELLWTSYFENSNTAGSAKTTWYLGAKDTMETTSIGNVFKYYPRRITSEVWGRKVILAVKKKKEKKAAEER